MPFAESIEPLDNYYSEDLMDAVTQAKEQPHHYDYSNSYRYKRTTAQSIDLNRIDLEEMDDTRLSINTNKPETNDTVEVTNLSIESSLPQQSDSKSIKTISPIFDNNIPLSSSYQNSAGSYQASGIIQSGTITSTPRP
jgi:hypothetical protein